MYSSKKGKLVSIILPVYNGERYLGKAIQSCLDQTHDNFELIIVNDASTDDSLNIAENFANLDERIRVISNSENKQLPSSLNIGHKIAKGAYITWTSHDNLFEPKAIAILLEKIETENVDIVYSNFNIIDEDGNFKREVDLQNGRSLLLGNSVGACFLYKREAYERSKGYDEELHAVEDYDFWLQACLHSSFAHIDRVLYHFRSHELSLTSKLEEKELRFNEKLAASYAKFFQVFDLPKDCDYASLFARLHQHKAINVLSFLHNYRYIEVLMNVLGNSLGKSTVNKLERDIDLSLRENLEYHSDNHNLEVLIKTLSTRPKLLFGYERKRSLQIARKCLL